MVYDGLDVPDVLEFAVSSASSYGVESNASTASMLVRSIINYCYPDDPGRACFGEF